VADINLPYRKTPAGVQELASRALGLTREQRNLLIVTDGRTALTSFCRAVGCDEAKLTALANDLLQMGLIEPAGLGRLVGGTAGGTDANAAPIADVADLRRQVIELATRMFGGQAKGMTQKIEAAGASPIDLVAAITAASKLAKLTIDEQKSHAFASEAKKILGL
jgi:hypothetical protein